MNFANVKNLVIPEGSVKQIEDGQGVVLWRKSQPLQITSITDPTVGSHTITGDRSCQLVRAAQNSNGTFYVFFKNYDINKGAGIKLTGNVHFSYCYSGASTLYSNVVFNNENAKKVEQTNYNPQTKLFEFIIYPSTDTGSFRVRIYNGTNTGDSPTVTVNLNLQSDKFVE